MTFKEKLEDVVAKHPVASGIVTGGISLGIAATDFINKAATYQSYKDDPSAILLGISVPAVIGAATTYIGRQIRKYREEHKKLEELAERDELTGLYNRRGFERRAKENLEFAKRAEQKMMVMYVDIDDLKRINTDYGHDAGDQAIKYVAIAVKRAMPRQTDVVARVGGDEYKGLGIIKEEPEEVIINRFQEAIRDFQEEVSFPLSASFGFREVNPKEFENIEDMMKYAMTKAEGDMYRSKEIKKNGLHQNS